MVVFPSGGGAFAVVVGVTAFPDKVVFVTDGFDGGCADVIEEAGVDGLVIGVGPAGDVLKGFPVGLAIGRIGVEPSGFAGDAIGLFCGGFDGGIESAFVEV